MNEKVKELKEGLEAKVKNILENSEELKNFISFRRKNFKNYSVRNSLLIFKQMPGASKVAGFGKWKELGYSVNKGEKAINILIPLARQSSDEEEKSQVIYGYKCGSVFDISQVSPKEGTDVIHVPQIDIEAKISEDMKYSEASIYNATKSSVEEFCEVIFDNNLECLGCTNGKEITIKSTSNLIDMAIVLAHEFVHFKSHFKENRKELSKNQKEVEAELGALIFGATFNVNIENLYKYVAVYSNGIELENSFDKVYKVIEGLIDRVESILINNNVIKE